MHKLFLSSFKGYKRKYILSDARAALVVTTLAVPQSLGLAAIAGLPLEAGLYSAMFAPILFALFAHTKRLIIGVDSATAALVASGAGLVAAAGTIGYANAVLALGLMTGIVLLLVAILRLGFLADLISRPVMIGFLSGVGIQILVHEAPKLFGLEAGRSVWGNISTLFEGIPAVNGMTITVSILVIGVMLLTKKTRIPGELLGVVMASLFAWWFHIEKYDVAMVGALSTSLPHLAWPSLSWDMILQLLPVALSLALVVLAQSSSVVRSLGSAHDEKVQLNRDLFALGLANIASVMTRGFTVNGSPLRSMAAESSGGRSQLVNILMAVGIGLIVLFGGGLLASTPQAALAAIVCVLGIRLIHIKDIVYLWKTHRTEFFVALIALLGTVLLGVRDGILIAIAVALMERLSRQYHPQDAVLLRDGELSDWAKDRVEDVSAKQMRGVLVYRFDNALFFENIEYFMSRLRAAIDRAKDPVQYVVIDAGAIDNIDYTAVEYMKQLYRQLSEDEIKIGFAHVSPNLKKQLEDFGVVDLVGRHNIFPTLSAALESSLPQQKTARERIQSLNLEKDQYVVCGGACLELYGLRNSNDIDIVVSDEVYREFRDKNQWKEYAQYNGKRVLTKDNCNLMHSWQGKSLNVLARNATVVDGVRVMGVDQLIEAKRRIGRKKDLADIELLLEQRKHR